MLEYAQKSHSYRLKVVTFFTISACMPVTAKIDRIKGFVRFCRSRLLLL